MDRIEDLNDDVIDLGVASVETKGQVSNFPEEISAFRLSTELTE